jgi:hypothetical protein
MKARLKFLALAATASFLAAGCCCPGLSGRYRSNACCQQNSSSCCQQTSDACCQQHVQDACPQPVATCPPDANASACPCDDCNAGCSHGCLLPGCHLRGWLAGWRHGVPSQQQPDYYSPPAKFHPIPTRPAFEPLASYPPLLPTDSGMNNPLRAAPDRPGAPQLR